MILVLGSTQEPIIEHIYRSLCDRKMDAVLIEQSDIPNLVRLSVEAAGNELKGYFVLRNSRQLDFDEITSVYTRVGLGYFEVYEHYSQQEIEFVNSECLISLSWVLDSDRFLVLNRPSASRSNASKPHQINLIRKFGFLVPNTIVSNNPEHIVTFYEACKKQAIYKSISSVRSIVQKMTDEDLERLDKLQHCPIQVQEYIEGHDVRVHVVGQECFASMIVSEKSDYRYDRTNTMAPFNLPNEIKERCIITAHGLGLPLAGLDLRVTPDGDYYCFEANPSPVFTYYESRSHFDTPEPITDAVCSLLNQSLF